MTRKRLRHLHWKNNTNRTNPCGWKKQLSSMQQSMQKKAKLLLDHIKKQTMSIGIQKAYSWLTSKHLLCSGFAFSHYDLPFPTCYCIPYVRSGLYQLVIRVKGFRVCALRCVRAITSITHCTRFCPSAWTPHFQ